MTQADIKLVFEKFVQMLDDSKILGYNFRCKTQSELLNCLTCDGTRTDNGNFAC